MDCLSGWKENAMPVAPFVPLIAAGVGAAGSVVAANASNRGQQQTINASQQAADAATAEQRRQYDLSRSDNAPYTATGRSALTELANLYGLSTGNGANRSTYDFLRANPSAQSAIDAGYFGGNSDLNSAANFYQNQYGFASNPAQSSVSGGREIMQGTVEGNPAGGGQTGVTAGTAPATGSSNMGGFFASPDYQFRQNEQARALTARNAALGIQDSGAAQRSAMQYSGNLASGEFNNYANRLASLAGIGQTAVGQNAQLGQNFANSVGQIGMNNAQVLGSSYQNQADTRANLYGGLAGGLSNGLTQYFGQRR